MAAAAGAGNVSMADMSEAVIWWGSAGPGGFKGRSAGYLINSMPTIWGLYEQHQAAQAAAQAREKLAQAREKLAQAGQDKLDRDREEQQRQAEYARDHTWFAWCCNNPEHWFNDDYFASDRRVQDDRPPVDARNQIWLSASEQVQAGKLAGSSSLTSDQISGIYGGPGFELVAVYHRDAPVLAAELGSAGRASS